MTWFTRLKKEPKEERPVEPQYITDAKVEFARLKKEVEPLVEKLSAKATVELKRLADQVEAIEGFGGAVYYADLLRARSPSNLSYNKQVFYDSGYVKMFLHTPQPVSVRTGVASIAAYSYEQRLFETRAKRAILLPWWVDNLLLVNEEHESILRSLPSGWFDTEDCRKMVGGVVAVKRKMRDQRALIPVSERVKLY
ncbi:MAG: hypothetical protein ACRC6V_13395 [Bacteroidales bacterium]